jgi:DNA-binding GntR family transcriptional regulator
MSDLNLAAINYPSISTTIADQIRGIIRDGSVQPGQSLSESKIAAQLHVSRGPVREALQRLVQEGLLVRVPNRGVSVAEITPTDVAEIYEARETLEARCGTKVLTGTEELLRRTVEELQAIVDKMGPAERDGQWGEVVELDLSFHTCLVTASNNSRIQRAYSTLIVESSLSINRLERWYPDDASLFQEHQDIVHAIAARDEAAFSRALTFHYLPSFH